MRCSSARKHSSRPRGSGTGQSTGAVLDEREGANEATGGHGRRFVLSIPLGIRGRQLGLTWYGGYGIGANDWREADVVLLFDYHYLPQRIVIATAQGLMGHNTTEGILSPTQHDKTAHPHVKALSTGHVLRWLKQMA